MQATMKNNENKQSHIEDDASITVKARIPKKMASLQQEFRVQIITLRAMVAGLFVALVIAMTSISKLSSGITVHIPPDLSSGVTMSAGDYPRANVLTNTSYLWVSINTWMQSGEVDAEKNLVMYENYMSKAFIRDMRQIMKDRSLDRQRRLTLAPGVLSEYTKRVIPLTKGSWVVYLDVVEEEWFLGERVRHSKIRYPIKVEKYTTNAELNPIELKIVGFYEAPTVIEEL